MKTAISIPDAVYNSAEKLASRLGQSRSQLYAKAVASYVEKHQSQNITNKLNEVYGDSGSSVDPVLMSLQNKTLLKNNPW